MDAPTIAAHHTLRARMRNLLSRRGDPNVPGSTRRIVSRISLSWGARDPEQMEQRLCQTVISVGVVGAYRCTDPRSAPLPGTPPWRRDDTATTGVWTASCT